MSLIRVFCITALLCFVAPPNSFAEILGPYSGTVIDATTGKPIEGASVLFYWRKRIPGFESSSELIDAKLSYTDPAGKYSISMTVANTGLMGLDSTHVIIYQPGYQAYMKMIWHDSSYAKPDPDFLNSRNVVKLERVPPNFDYKAHFERIEEAVRLLERDDYSEKKDETWGGILKRGLRMPLEREQFLRRVEWEQRRPGKVGRQ